jgi:predicted acylesterase/phospholipase RssA
MTTARRATAFVLSGGASLGAIQVGMLRALYEREIAPHRRVDPPRKNPPGEVAK